MRIADANGNALDRVYVALTDSEAKQLHDFLEQLMVEESFHAHVVDDRFWSDNEADCPLSWLSCETPVISC